MVRTIASRSAQRPSHRTCDGAARDPPTCATCAIATSALRRPPQSPRRCACSGRLNRSCPSEVKSGPCSLTGRPYAHLQARSHVRAPSGRTRVGLRQRSPSRPAPTAPTRSRQATRLCRNLHRRRRTSPRGECRSVSPRSTICYSNIAAAAAKTRPTASKRSR